MSNTQLHKDDVSCPQSWPYQSTISLVYLRRHELNSVPFSTSLCVQICVLQVGHLCVLRQCLWSNFYIFLFCINIVHNILIIKTFKNLGLQTSNSRTLQSAIQPSCHQGVISWLFPSPSHVDPSAFIPSFPLTMGTSQAFLITENAGTEMPPPKLCHRFSAPSSWPSNYKENKKIPSQLIWMSKRSNSWTKRFPLAPRSTIDSQTFFHTPS